MHKLRSESSKDPLETTEKEKACDNNSSTKEKSHFHMFAKTHDEDNTSNTSSDIVSIPCTPKSVPSNSSTSTIVTPSDNKRKSSFTKSEIQEKKLRICENSSEANDGIKKPSLKLSLSPTYFSYDSSNAVTTRREFCPQKEGKYPALKIISLFVSSSNNIF